MDVPPPKELLERVRALPAAAPLMARLGDWPEVHLVGGAVRDLLLEGRPFDLDLVVLEDALAFASSLGEEIRVHDRFGTSTVVLDGFSYDIALARRETYAAPGALPDVSPARLEEDLKRRDFTVNAAAIALTGPTAGELNAAPRALEDLGSGRLRVLHDQSFVDDPTRLLRLARYAGRLGFTIEPHTGALAGEAVAEGALRTVSGERVGSELRLLAREEDPIDAMRSLRELGLDRAVHRQFGLEEEDLAIRAVGLLPEEDRRDRLILAVAARRMQADELKALLDSLGFDARDREVIVAATTGSDALARTLRAARTPSEIARAAASAEPELVALGGALGPEEKAREWLEHLRHVQLAIDGRDLLAAGVPEGPAIGEGLRAALAAKLDGRAAGREAELAHALRAARDTG